MPKPRRRQVAIGKQGHKVKAELARKSSTVARIKYGATGGAGKVVKETALPLWANFRQRALDVAIAEINKTTDLNGAYQALRYSGQQSQKTCYRSSSRDFHLSRARRGASASERCRSALWRNVCPSCGKSGIRLVAFTDAAAVLHMSRRTNPMRFLMNTLLAHPIPRLIHAFPAKLSLDTLGSRRCLRVPCEAPLSPSEVTGVAQLQLLIFWRQFNPAFQSCWHGNLRIQNPSLPSSTPHCARYFSHTVGTSGVGFVQPSSRSPPSP